LCSGCKIWFPYGSGGSIPFTRTISIYVERGLSAPFAFEDQHTGEEGKIMKVTFDTNSLDRACRPERFSKDPNQPLYQKVYSALKAETLNGFYYFAIIWNPAG
jgi:hypothetical protein